MAAAPPHVPERGNKTLGRWKVYKASNAVTKVNKQPQQASLSLSLHLSPSLSLLPPVCPPLETGVLLWKNKTRVVDHPDAVYNYM